MAKIIKVSAADESQKQEVRLKSDELFENDDQSNENDVQINDDKQSNDEDENENDNHSKENDEVNGDKYDQVKIEELFNSIAILLFFPNYKYRKKRWPENLNCET